MLLEGCGLSSSSGHLPAQLFPKTNTASGKVHMARGTLWQKACCWVGVSEGLSGRTWEGDVLTPCRMRSPWQCIICLETVLVKLRHPQCGECVYLGSSVAALGFLAPRHGQMHESSGFKARRKGVRPEGDTRWLTANGFGGFFFLRKGRRISKTPPPKGTRDFTGLAVGLTVDKTPDVLAGVCAASERCIRADVAMPAEGAYALGCEPLLGTEPTPHPPEPQPESQHASPACCHLDVQT